MPCTVVHTLALERPAAWPGARWGMEREASLLSIISGITVVGRENGLVLLVVLVLLISLLIS